MDPITIAALIAMVAGSAMQYKATTDASKRQTRETQLALARQDELQKQAEQKAMGQAKEFTTDDRAKAQDAITEDLTREFMAPVQSAQQINAAQSTTQGDVSGDYTAAKARSNVATLKNAEGLARLLGKTTGASRLRGNEAIRMADTAAGIDRLSSFSRGQAGADQLAIQAAGRPNAELQLAGGLLSALGGAGMAGAFNGAGNAPSGAAATTDAWAGTAPKVGATGTTATGTGYTGPFATGGGGIGVRIPKILGG